MLCPLCNKEMREISHEAFSSLNPMTCEEHQECECGVSYEFSYGAERFLDKDGEEINIQYQIIPCKLQPLIEKKL